MQLQTTMIFLNQYDTTDMPLFPYLHLFFPIIHVNIIKFESICLSLML